MEWHLRIRYGTDMDSSPPLLGGADLPGPLCLNTLHSMGAICKLDNENAYTYHDARTLYGRASIIATLLPSRSVACAGTAAWVWLGGRFPETIDIIAKAHCRALRYGRRISVFNRRTPDSHVIAVGPITITTPPCTACDLMQEFRFRPADCLQVMREATHIRNAPWARNFFRTIEGKL